jgi:hypothetical protein
MRRLSEWLFDTSRYSSSVDRDRARMVYGIALLIMFLYGVFALVALSPSEASLFQPRAPGAPSWAFHLAVVYLCCGGAIWAVRAGRLEPGALGPLAGWLGSAVFVATSDGYTSAIDGISLLAFVLVAGLLHHERGLLAATTLALIALTPASPIAPIYPSRYVRYNLYDYV